VAFRDKTKLRVRLAFPTVIRAWDEPVLRLWLQDAFKRGFTAYEIGNPGAIGLIREWGLPADDLSSDFTLYAMNREAVAHWRDQGVVTQALSIEDDLEDLTSLLSNWPRNGARPQVIAYKDTPLFVAEACSLTALHQGCPTNKVCGYRTLEIENSKGERFFVAHEGCKSVVYGKTAYSVAGSLAKLEALGVSDYRADFLTRPYTKEQFMDVLKAVAGDQVIPETHSANFDGRLK
jgi:putative protease